MKSQEKYIVLIAICSIIHISNVKHFSLLFCECHTRGGMSDVRLHDIIPHDETSYCISFAYFSITSHYITPYDIASHHMTEHLVHHNRHDPLLQQNKQFRPTLSP